jgi:MFS-type transporter involved in bile tolerance (Atg22 family)
MLPQNVVGGAFALINGMGALGSFVGVFAVGFLNGSTGNPSASYFFMAGALLAAVGVTLVVPRAAAETMTGEVLATS